jgi:hypothetical protein
MEVKVLDPERAASPAKRRAHRSRVVGEYSPLNRSEVGCLSGDEAPCVEPARGEERYALVIARLVPRILAIPDEEHSPRRVQIAPFDPANFVQTHRGCHGELNHTCHWDGKPGITVEMARQPLEFVVGWSPVALNPFADQPKPFEGKAGEIDRLGRNIETMYRSGMSQDQADRPDVDAEGHRTCARHRPGSPVVDQSLTVDVADPELAKVTLQCIQGCGLAAAGRFSDSAHVGYVEVDKFPEGREARHG